MEQIPPPPDTVNMTRISISTLFIILSLLYSAVSWGQDTAMQTKEPKPFTLSGYIETYYSFDFNKPSPNRRPSFLYNFNRHNEFNLNLGYIKATYTSARVRGNLAIGLGTYMNANYAAEPAVLRHIFEANAGVKLLRGKNLWLDIGIMPSHIGFETAVGKDNWTLTRSMVAENSPYFESGAKLSYTSDNDKFQVALLALNGWQRITRQEGNSLMSFGTQLYLKPNDAVSFNYSTFFGTDKPDSARLFRTYHNLYAVFDLSPAFGVITGFDIGTQQKEPGSGTLNTWYTPVIMLRYSPEEHWAFAIRGEYYADEAGVIISTVTSGSFRTTGVSFNVDYMPVKNVALRLESRYFKSRDPVFVKNGTGKDNNTAISFSCAVAFKGNGN